MEMVARGQQGADYRNQLVFERRQTGKEVFNLLLLLPLRQSYTIRKHYYSINRCIRYYPLKKYYIALKYFFRQSALPIKTPERWRP